jgi:hypothetical protein
VHCFGKEADIYDVTVSDAGDDFDVDWELRKESEVLQQEAVPGGCGMKDQED